MGKHIIILFEIFLTRSKKGHGSVSFLPFSLSSDAFLLDPIIASSCESLSHHLLTLLNFVKIGFVKVVTWIYLVKGVFFFNCVSGVRGRDTFEERVSRGRGGAVWSQDGEIFRIM